MILTCYGCHQPFTVTGWNPARITAPCPQPGCGRLVHPGLAAERTYGQKTGDQVRKLLAPLPDLNTHRDHTALIALTSFSIERIFNDAENARQARLTAVLTTPAMVKAKVKLHAPTTVNLDVCAVAEKLQRKLRKEKRP